MTIIASNGNFLSSTTPGSLQPEPASSSTLPTSLGPKPVARSVRNRIIASNGGLADGPSPSLSFEEPPSHFERYITAPFGRGIDRFQGLAYLAVNDEEGWARNQLEAESGVQLTAEDQNIMRQISETDSLWEALKLYGTNPRLIAAIGAESIGLFTPSLIAGAAATATGPVGVAAMIGLGSGATEYLATIEQKAVEAGADPRDPASMDRLLQDPNFMAQARKAGIARSIPIAALDAISVGAGGWLFTKGAKGVAARLLQATGEIGIQGALGGTGEALAQLAEYGRITNKGEIAGEIVGEFGTGPIEIATALRSRSERAKPTAPPTTPPDRSRSALGVPGEQLRLDLPGEQLRLDLPGGIQQDRMGFDGPPAIEPSEGSDVSIPVGPPDRRQRKLPLPEGRSVPLRREQGDLFAPEQNLRTVPLDATPTTATPGMALAAPPTRLALPAPEVQQRPGINAPYPDSEVEPATSPEIEQNLLGTTSESAPATADQTGADVTERPATDLVPARPFEQSILEEEDVDTQPLADAIKAFNEAQEYVEGRSGTKWVRRQKPLFQKTSSSSKVTPYVQLKRDINSLHETAIDAGLILPSAVEKLSAGTKKEEKVAAHVANLLRAIYNSEKSTDTVKQIVRRVLSEFNNTNAFDIHDAFVGANSFLAGDLNLSPKVAGSLFESRSNQAKRAQVRADAAFAKDSPSDSRERLRELQGFYRAVKARFERRIGFSLGDSDQRLPVKALAAKLVKQPKYVKKGAEIIARASGRMFGATDMAIAGRQGAYEELSKLNADLDRFESKALVEHDKKLAEYAENPSDFRRRKIAADEKAVKRIAQERKENESKPQKRSEIIPRTAEGKLDYDAIREENQARREQERDKSRLRQSSAYISNASATGTEKEARAPKKQPEEITKSSKKKDVELTEEEERAIAAEATNVEKMKPIATPQEIARHAALDAERAKWAKDQRERRKKSPEEAVAEARKADLKQKREKRDAFLAAQARKVSVKPKKHRSLNALRRGLRLNNIRGDLALLSNINFFQVLNDHRITFSERNNSDAAWISGLRDTLPANIRKEFDSLIDTFINLPVQEGGHPAFESEIKSFIKEHVSNANALVKPPYTLNNIVINYARALRTLQNRGFEQGTIVLENVSPTNEAENRYLAELNSVLAPSLEGVILREKVPSLEPVTANFANANLLKAGARPVSAAGVLRYLQSILPKDHHLVPIIDRLLATGIDMPFGFMSGSIIEDGEQLLGTYSTPFNINNPAFDPTLRMIKVWESLNDATKYASFVVTAVHEYSHAATQHKYDTDARVRNAVDELFSFVKKRTTEDWRGLADPYEFLSEFFANKAFREHLNSIVVSGTPTVRVTGVVTALQRMWQWISEAFGWSKAQVTALETILNIDDQYGLLSSETEVQALAGYDHVKAATRTTKTDFGGSLNNVSAVTNIPNKIESAKEKAANAFELGIDAARAGNLGLMNLDTMERRYRALVAAAAKAIGLDHNPLSNLVQAVGRTSRSAREIADFLHQIAREVKKLSPTETLSLGRAMEIVTRAQLDPNQKVDPATQPWLFKKDGTLARPDLVDKAKTAYAALNEPTKAAFNAMKDLVKESRTQRLHAALKHSLQIRFEGIEENDLNALSSAANLEDYKTYVKSKDIFANGELITPENLVQPAEIIYGASEIPGTYFPLLRSGKWVTVIDADNVEDAYFAMHATRRQAEEDAARLQSEGREGAEVHPRIRGQTEPGTLKAVQAILHKLNQTKPGDADVNDKVGAMLNNAMAEILSDRILYASRLKRAGIEGAKPADMLKNVEDYVRASVSAISSLESAYDHKKALGELAKIQSSIDVDIDTKQTVRLIRDELLLRAEEVAGDRDIVATDRVLGSIGFFTYLGAPSYWILNATQTAVVGVPVLAGLANKGYLQASSAMKRAYKQLYDASQGRKALTEDLEATKARLPKETAAIITRLEEDNVIQSTLAHEWGELHTPGIPIYSKVTDVLTAVPEAIERFNRISMALAAIDLEVTDYQTIKDIVESSQFNYDPAMRARLLKYAPKFFGGGARRFVAPMMMFKVFGVNMAHLVYGNLYDVITGSNDRKTAAKILVGVIGSHTLAGGVFGGLGLGMAQIVGAAINAMLDDEDRIDWEDALDEFIAEHTNDYIARLVTRGLPAAVGVDMSSSINLGNLLFMSHDIDLAAYGGVEQKVFTFLGPVAQYFSGSTREVFRFLDGESSVADVLEKSVPLKLYKALSQAYRYGMEGLETRQGQQFLDPEELNVGNIVTTALGLRSAVISQRQQRFYADRTYTRTLESKKAQLLREAATAETASERAKSRADRDVWNRKMEERGNRSLIIKEKSVRRSRSARSEVSRRYRGERYTEYN